MPSTLIMVQSGGQLLVSGNVFSGVLYPTGSLQLRLSSSGPGPVYVGLVNLSGTVATMLSGGSLSSGGLADGWELVPGGTYAIPKNRLVSGILTPRILAPAASSGGRLFWEVN